MGEAKITGGPEILSASRANEIIYNHILDKSGSWVGDIPQYLVNGAFYYDFVYCSRKGKFLIRAYYVVDNNGGRTRCGCFERYRCKYD